MRGVVLGLLAVAGLAASPPPAVTPTPTPGASPSVAVDATPQPARTEPAGPRVHVMADPDASPTPTPTPEPSHNLVAALDVQQGEGGERTAIFDDGTLVRVIRLGDRVTTSRRSVSREELEVVSRVVREALAETDEGERKSPVLGDDARRRLRLEVREPSGRVRQFVFDEVSILPLPLGRARSAMEDLRARFIVRAVEGSDVWDASGVKAGDVLKRRGDGRWFRVVRDDSFEENLELREVGSGGLGQFLKRDEIPKVFEDPASLDSGDGPPR